MNRYLEFNYQKKDRYLLLNKRDKLRMYSVLVRFLNMHNSWAIREIRRRIKNARQNEHSLYGLPQIINFSSNGMIHLEIAGAVEVSERSDGVAVLEIDHLEPERVRGARISLIETTLGTRLQRYGN